VLAWAAAEHPDAAYVLLLNPDVALAPDFAGALGAAVAERPRVALASGRLTRPEGLLDSAGIRLPRHRRPRDRGSEERDAGQYAAAELVFGVSGAAMWVRRAALADLALEGEVFDEDFFAYQDDTDLCWRAGRLGWEVLYEPRARAVHRRGWRRDERHRIDVAVRRHSFKNHYLQILKNERGRDLAANLPWLAAWEVLRLGFAVLRDPAILPAYAAAWRAAPAALRKRRALQAKLRGRRLSLNPKRSIVPTP
jgi:GT2 family glycosyltransferase